MTALPKLRLVSFNLCPFVQRSIIALNEKSIPFDITYIDLAAKPDWFLEISPSGKVPVLVVDEDTALFESAVISEYIDEVTPGTLHPTDPLTKAVHRGWIEFASALAGEVYRMMVATDEDACRAAAADAHDRLSKLESRLGEGPFYAGEAFSMVDAGIAPMMQRLTWMEGIRDLGVFSDLPRASAWRDALVSRPSVQASVLPTQR
jgi:glutathione S-transferase